MIRASIIGAAGYTGGELLRTLLGHPRARIAHAVSESSAGKPAHAVHLDLLGRTDLFLEKLDAARIVADSDVVFLCLPHAASAKTGKQFLGRKLRVIDLSADFRLKSKAVYEKWYGIKHPHPELLGRAVYGLPELYRERIRKADLVANPGCYATTAILATLPLLARNLADPSSVVIDAKSGVSGAGKKAEPRYLFCEDNENFLAYGVAAHRHSPEIEQVLSDASARAVSVTFVPHLLPVNRGILATVYAKLRRKTSGAALREAYAEHYAGEPFVQVLPHGSFPELKSVQHTNFCRIGATVDERNGRAVVVAVLDNLGKGASTQAVQNMNLMFQLGETTGLL